MLTKISIVSLENQGFRVQYSFVSEKLRQGAQRFVGERAEPLSPPAPPLNTLQKNYPISSLIHIIIIHIHLPLFIYYIIYCMRAFKYLCSYFSINRFAHFWNT
jgi:hypothetical protein